ncbi:MAG: tetratricopeptide repeat protein [Alphaproteobacteria bacterium]|nr:tetratricopeptide repeat protein [Alphaproteobacteria bacterium]
MHHSFNLDAELAAGVEGAKRKVERERENATEALRKVLSEAQAGAVSPKAIGLVKRAVGMMDNGRAAAAKAAKLCLKALDIDSDFALANHAMALCLERLGRLSSALNFYERAWKLNPKDPEIYLNLGMLAWKLEMMEAAEKFLRLHNTMDPRSIGGISNLAGLLRDLQKFEDSIELLRTAIYANPDSPDLWNSLGTTLLESGDPLQALTFYEEALRLQENFARAHHNMAFCYDLTGDTDRAIMHFRKALTLNPSEEDRVTMEHGLSMALLSKGQLAEGWELYERRLDPHYKKSVHVIIEAPYWSGADREEVRGKRLLLVGEQGLGDEVMHAGDLEQAFDLVGPDGAVALVCERRLTGIMERSFPKLEYVGFHSTITKEGLHLRHLHEAEPTFKPDLWAPLGSLQRALHPTPESFGPAGARAYLTPDPDRVEALRAQIGALPAGLRVGIVWKSNLMTGNRTKYFSPFHLWRPALQTPGCTFVCLQYGDVEDEIAQCERDFGVTIHRIEGLDLKDDLEGVGITGSLMDVSVGQHNTSLALAAAYGGETWVMAPAKNQWTAFGTDRLPWSPGSTLFAPEKFRDFADPVGRIARALQQRAEERDRGAA